MTELLNFSLKCIKVIQYFTNFVNYSLLLYREEKQFN